MALAALKCKNYTRCRCSWLTYAVGFSFALAATPLFGDEGSPPLPVENSNIFNSSLYDSYLAQLRSFLESEAPRLDRGKEPSSPSPLEKEGLSFLKYIESAPGKNGEMRAAYHEGLIDRLRALIALSKNSLKQSTLEGELDEFLQKFALWIFGEVKVDREIYRYLFTDLGLPQAVGGREGEAPLEELFPLIYRTIKGEARFFDRSYRTREMEDQIRAGDFPYHLYTFSEGGKEVELIRTPNVTRDIEVDPATGETVEAKVNEEFLLYLQAQSKRRRVHLYVNLMRRSGDEGIKTGLIEGLEDGKNFFVLTLEKSKTPFYFQSEEFSELSDAALFKHLFLERLLEEGGEYHLPKSETLQDWRGLLREALEELHLLDFGGREQLERGEREQFIELAYLKILHLAIAIVKPDAMNISCRQSLDRGPSLYSLFLLEKELEKSSPNLNMVAALFYAPPLLSLNRWSHDYRVSRFIESSSRLQRRRWGSF